MEFRPLPIDFSSTNQWPIAEGLITQLDDEEILGICLILPRKQGNARNIKVSVAIETNASAAF